MSGLRPGDKLTNTAEKLFLRLPGSNSHYTRVGPDYISSANFKMHKDSVTSSPLGLSCDMKADRDDATCLDFLLRDNTLQGAFSLTVGDCISVGTEVEFSPIPGINEFHCDIWGSHHSRIPTKAVLELKKLARIEKHPT